MRVLCRGALFASRARHERYDALHCCRLTRWTNDVVQFIDDADGTHAEPKPDADGNRADANTASRSQPNTQPFADATITITDAIADTVAHAIAFTDAGSESCTTTNDVHILGNRQRRAGPSGCRRHRTRRSRFGDH